MVESLSPDSYFRRCVSTMALVRNYEIECVDWDVEFFGIFFDFFLAAPHGLTTEEVDGHSLDRRDVHERVAGFRSLKMRFREKLGIEFFLLSKIFLLKSLAIHFIDLVELEPLFCLE